jgi:NADPH:quinone reductase-like Zn-dependent oxidoreductase
MKAYDLVPGTTGPDALKLVDKPEPSVGPGQIKLKVKAISLNFRDIMIANNLYGGPRQAPVQPISDGAGEVVEIGEGVKSLKVGDRVAPLFFPDWQDGQAQFPKIARSLGASAPGMAAEYTVHGESEVVKLADHMSFEDGASLPCAALTAWHALIGRGGPNQLVAGQTVLALGTGGVSIFALQIGKLSGARVIITSSSDKKLERAKALGADGLVNYKTNPDWQKAVLEMTGGVGVDHVLEVGGAGTFPRSAQATTMQGKISLIGGLSGSTEPVSLGAMFGKNVSGITVGSRAMMEAMVKAFAVAKTRAVVDKDFAFDQLAEAYRYQIGGSHFGKIVVSV